MPSYDPQRSRSRRRATEDEGPAPVDALLGPSPDDTHETDETHEPVPAAEVDVVPTGTPSVEPDEASPPRREPLVIDLDPPAPVNVPRHRGRVVLYGLAVLSVVLQVLAWLWWRRRKRSQAG